MKRTIRLTESELRNMISETMKKILKETRFDKNDNYPRLGSEKSRPDDIPPGDEDIYYPGDINPDVWNALQRGDYGEEKINEEGYSYNGEDYRKELLSKYGAIVDKENNYKENITRFKNAFKTVLRDYSIVIDLKKSKKTSETARRVFTMASFLNFIKKEEGQTLYDKIWEKYGGEYEEMADQYLQYWVLKLRK